jgi:hypothetical protein
MIINIQERYPEKKWSCIDKLHDQKGLIQDRTHTAHGYTREKVQDKTTLFQN